MKGNTDRSPETLHLIYIHITGSEIILTQAEFKKDQNVYPTLCK